MVKPVRRHCRHPKSDFGASSQDDDRSIHDISSFISSDIPTDDHASFEESMESIELQMELRDSAGTAAKHHMNTSYGHFFSGLDDKLKKPKPKSAVS